MRKNDGIGRGSSIGSEFAWHTSGPEFDPHFQHIFRGDISMAILPFLLIQAEQLSVSGERVLVNCLGGLPRNSVARLTDHARIDLKCIEGP